MEESPGSCIEKLRHNAVVHCAKDGCPNRKSDINQYCTKHQIWIFLDDTAALGKKACVNYVRGCREQLDTSYKFSRCEDCLKRDREKDKEKREAAKKKETDNVIKTGNKLCSFCHIEQHIDQFQGIKGGETKTCSDCREKFKKLDANRDKAHRNAIARKNERKPENVAVKKKWKEDNYEKVVGYWMKSRQNKIEKNGVDEYQKKNAENAKKWRENNPEKVLIINENKRKNLKLQYNVYFRSARDKNLDFQLSYEEYEKIVCGKCYYCGIIADKGFNGIDRKDQKQGYFIENCVNCCQMCNYMKKSLSDKIFIKRIEHILVYNKIVENGNLYPEIFANHIYGVNYRTYRHRANEKKFDFEITEQQFNEITKKDCYICGKQNSSEHRNGIDRYDSNIGYLIENCRSCCGECNYMKNNYDYRDMFEKFKLVYNNSNGGNCHFEQVSLKDVVETPEKETVGDCQPALKNTLIPFEEIEQFNSKEYQCSVAEKNDIEKSKVENIFVDNKSKKTVDEKREAARIRKQEKYKLLIEKYGDEEYRKMHAQQIAEIRRKKNSKDSN